MVVRQRLPADVFRLPVERIRDGYYSDAYFNQTKALLEHEGRDPRVVVQVFQRKESILGGVDEAIGDPARVRRAGARRTAAGSDAWDELEVKRAARGRPDRAVGDRDDRSRARTRASPTSRRSTSAAWRGARS